VGTSRLSLPRPQSESDADKRLTAEFRVGGPEAAFPLEMAMERTGIEPVTSGLQSRRSPS
jgi:hypothetical protein